MAPNNLNFIIGSEVNGIVEILGLDFQLFGLIQQCLGIYNIMSKEALN